MISSSHQKITNVCPLIARVVLVLLCVVAVESALAVEKFSIRNIEAEWQDNVYLISADIDAPLSSQVVEALHKGVVLTIVINIELTRRRKYWLNEDVAILEQRYQLRYYALTDHYVLTNLNSGVQNSFSSLQTVLGELESINNLPILDRKLLSASERYLTRMRVRLDLEALPAPLRVLVYFRSSWHLESEWYEWKLKM